MILAQLNVAPIELGGWMLCAGSALWIFNQARTAIGGSQKRDVKLIGDAQTSADCDRRHTELEKNRAEFKEAHNKEHVALLSSDEAQWARINKHEDDISSLKLLIGKIPAETARLIKEVREL